MIRDVYYLLFMQDRGLTLKSNAGQTNNFKN